MQGELLNAAILLRRGSWVDPELCDRAAKRLAELEADAKRYRWMRRDEGELYVLFVRDSTANYALCGGDLDAAIDAEIAKEAKQ